MRKQSRPTLLTVLPVRPDTDRPWTLKCLRPLISDAFIAERVDTSARTAIANAL